MRKTLYVTAIAVTAFYSLASAANATHVQCGDTITSSTSLDSDVVCPAGQLYGLIIGANDIVLQLNGHTVRSGTRYSDSIGIYGVAPPETPFLRVRIKNGTIDGFQTAVSMDASDSTVHKLDTVSTQTTFNGIRLRGDRNTVSRNNVRFAETAAIDVRGNDSYVWGNEVHGADFLGIRVDGERSRVISNSVDCTDVCANAGIAVYYRTTALVNRNTVSGDYAYGLYSFLTGPGDGPGARITLNDFQVQYAGMTVDDPGAVVARNVASNHGGYYGDDGVGIWSSAAGTTLRSNTTNNNTEYGIRAAPGTIDGGGNVASGNGDGFTPQCVNVSCGSP